MYQIVYKSSARKEIKNLPKDIQHRVISRIESLSLAPFQVGEKLHGYDDLYKVRVGNYRIIYSIENNILVITVVKVGHRKDVYRSF